MSEVDKYLEIYKGGLYNRVKIKGIKKVYDFCKQVLGKGDGTFVSIYYNPKTCDISGVEGKGVSIPDVDKLNKGEIYCGFMDRISKQWTLRWKVQKATYLNPNVKMEY